MNNFKLAVYIGRFQPFHIGHLETLKQGLAIADKVVMILGSYKKSHSYKNPFSFEERVEMIKSSVSLEESQRIIFEPIRDEFASGDYVWVANVEDAVHRHCKDDSEIVLIGKYKDASTYYIERFNKWIFQTMTAKINISASLVRETIFKGGDPSSLVPANVANFLEKNYIGTNKQIEHAEEYSVIEKYKKSWAGSPFPPVFVTVDPVVVCKGHVLLIRRGHAPGKGHLAIPGGFLEASETLRDAAVRELLEETNIDVEPSRLHHSIVYTETFDHPLRGDRGRIITHAFLFDLASLSEVVKLPEVKGGDDAAEAMWVKMSDLDSIEEEIYSDHLGIIKTVIYNVWLSNEKQLYREFGKKKHWS